MISLFRKWEEAYINTIYHVATSHLFLGETIEVEEDDDEEGVADEEDEEAYMKEQEAKLEAEKAAILNDQNLIAEVSHCSVQGRGELLFWLCLPVFMTENKF